MYINTTNNMNKQSCSVKHGGGPKPRRTQLRWNRIYPFPRKTKLKSDQYEEARLQCKAWSKPINKPSY
ncbi:hypothetical protein GDO81_024720 [Engystomops pustulosus]|uniref:Uncharacterized protein n=1 Tax=Engystomops pustulosus TaxID=76066 RepID=A0AAV6YQ73_ENGPU|nr:hypothetical protein GDO81_024720 [Engystomops pustulosus]